MTMIEINRLIKCGMPLCSGRAAYSVGCEGALPAARIYLCKKCAGELSELLKKALTPKSPENMIAKKTRKNSTEKSRENQEAQ